MRHRDTGHAKTYRELNGTSTRAACTVSPIEALWRCDLAGFGGGERFGSAVRAVWDTITEGRLDGACPVAS